MIKDKLKNVSNPEIITPSVLEEEVILDSDTVSKP